jgi:leader peptidase (prepilin peptidase)/N-methyltransferase
LAAVVAFIAYPPGPKAVMAAGLATALVIVTVTDLERRIIPNRIVLPAIALLLATRLGFYPSRAPEHALAALAVAFVLFLPNFLNSSAIGMGDVKLAALLGAGLGWPAFDAVALGFFLLAPLAVMTLIRGGMAARKQALPLGPFLACGGYLVLILIPLLGLKGA